MVIQNQNYGKIYGIISKNLILTLLGLKRSASCDFSDSNFYSRFLFMYLQTSDDLYSYNGTDVLVQTSWELPIVVCFSSHNMR